MREQFDKRLTLIPVVDGASPSGPVPVPWTVDQAGDRVQMHTFSDGTGIGIVVCIRQVDARTIELIADGTKSTTTLVERKRTTSNGLVTVHLRKP